MSGPVQRRINSLFNPVIRLLQAYGVRESNLFDNHQVKRYSIGPSSFYGHDCCGPASYALGGLLQCLHPELKLSIGYKKIGAGSEVEDHVFLRTRFCGEDLIIDPTWRQFFVRFLNDSESEHPYEEYLFHHLPPFWVGSKFALERETQKLERLADEKNLIETDWWITNCEPPFELDLFRCLEDHRLAQQKSVSVQRMIEAFRDEVQKIDN